MNKNLLETIKIIDGKIQNLSYHQARYENSLHTLNKEARYHLQELIVPPTKGIYRCRVIYNEDDVTVSYHPYTFHEVTSLKLIHNDNINYSLKYENREYLDLLFEQREGCDDIVIVKNGYITDTSKANLAFFDGSKWYTPASPLLYGTTRARYLDEGKIFEKQISADEMQEFANVAVLNAMVDFCIVKNGIIL
ncbi:aminotransferase class IV family protein [Sulfurimonas sp. HSL-1716]|uniref:aminotransferase class IV family protein n=1 Tax=Hydrocurvibacter sulfurireducens TaxID=3131937 RepID=UPI0031F9D826